MTNNTLLSLNDKLFAQLERLSSPGLHGDALEEELKRADAVVDVGKTIISNADLMLKAAIACDEKLGSYSGALPEPLQVSGKTKV